MEITVAADGSALGNPGPAGWAWFVDENNWAAGGWEHATNNRGELMAVIDFLEATAPLPHLRIHFLCDSQYVINSVTQWMPGWKRRGWRKADKKPVLNADLMQRLDTLLQGRKFDFEWVKGHAGHNLNERADDLARAAATAFQAGYAPETGPGLGAFLAEAKLTVNARTREDLSATGRPFDSFTPIPTNFSDTPNEGNFQPTLF